MTAPAGAGLPGGRAVWIRQPFAGGEDGHGRGKTKRIPGGVREREKGKYPTTNIRHRTSKAGKLEALGTGRSFSRRQSPRKGGLAPESRYGIAAEYMVYGY